MIPLSDSQILDTCDIVLVDLPISLRKIKDLVPPYVSTKNLSTQYQSFIADIDYMIIPSSFKEALEDGNWVEAMNEEMRALEKNGN